MSQPDAPRGIEQMVRDTLVDPRRRLDPPPGHYQSVTERIGRARRRRNTRWLAAAVGVLAVLAVGGLFVTRTGTGPGPSARPSPSASPSASGPSVGQRHPLPSIGPGEPVKIVAADGWFYVLEDSPGTVLRLDRASFAIGASADVPGTAESLAVDAPADRLWVGYHLPTGISRVREYVASTLALLRDVPTTDRQVFSGVAVDGELWLGTDGGVLRVGPSDQAARPVPGFEQMGYALTLDPGRHRLLMDAPAGVIAMDPATLAVTRGASLSLVKESIAVVAGQVWVGGYASGEERRIYHLDPTTLQVSGTSPVGDQVGPGAIVSAGSSSLWVHDGGDTGAFCVDPVSGAIRQQWQRSGDPIASLPGVAVSVDPPGLAQLMLSDGCAG